jgi:molybdopterin-containing oxidoreductase family membrane subunit
MSVAKKIGFGVTGFFMATGLAAWIYQYKEGLILTNMGNSYSWGLYVSTLAFFVGNAAGGLVLSSLIYLFGAVSLKPFARIGALTAFANVTAAMAAILPDMGQPMRLYKLFLYPNVTSPLIWDVIVLNLYAAISLAYLYILMLPDLKGRWKSLALKVDDPQAFSEKWAKRMAPYSLVAAVGIHVITAWIFATQGAREWWHTSVLAPDFVSVALASGTAVVLIVCVLAYGFREEYSKAYRTMAAFIATAFFIHLFLMYNDFIIQAWYGADEAMETLAVTLKEYGLTHAFEVGAPLLAVILLLNQRIRRSAGAMIFSSGLLILGVFAHRYLLMPAAFERIPFTMTPLGLQNVSWSFPITSGRYAQDADVFVTAWHYFPSPIEWTIFLGVISYACFVILLATDQLPVTQQVKR